MKVIRKVDELGRVDLPFAFLSAIDAGSYSSLYVTSENGHILLKNTKTTCALCGEISRLKDCGGYLLCNACIEKIKSCE